MVNNKFWEYSITDAINVGIGVCGLMLSGITLFIAYKIYKNFDAKKTHINKQLETVLNLVEDINKTIISVNFKIKIPKQLLDKMAVNTSKTGFTKYPYSLFVISEINNKRDQYGNVVLSGSSEIFKVLPFLTYINNPLLPRSIADALKAFYSPVNKYFNFPNLSERFVVLSDDHKEDFYLIPDFKNAYKDWDSFIQCSKDLKYEIQQWLKKYGAEDINFNHTIQLPATGLP